MRERETEEEEECNATDLLEHDCLSIKLLCRVRSLEYDCRGRKPECAKLPHLADQRHEAIAKVHLELSVLMIKVHEAPCRLQQYVLILQLALHVCCPVIKLFFLENRNLLKKRLCA